jgi:hypothetical protein
MMAVDNNNNNNNHTINNETTKRSGEYSEEFLLQRARELIAERTKSWEITNVKAEGRIPRFHRDGTWNAVPV